MTEPPDADPHVRWCGRKGVNHPLLSRLPVGGLFGLVGILLRGPDGVPLADPLSWAETAASNTFAIAQFAIIIGFVLPFLGFWALYAWLQAGGRERGAFWGFMLSIWGTTLALPALGIAAFAGPLAADLYLQGDQAAATLIADALTGRGFYVSIVSAICFIAGPALLGIAVWRTGTLPKVAGFLFAVHGVCLSLGFGFYPVLVLGWVLLIVSSIWLAIPVWRSAQA